MSDNAVHAWLLTERDVSNEFNFRPKTLQGWRLRGGGPEYVKCGRSVRYRRDAIEQWLDSRTRNSTSDTSDREARQ